jgi:hypothetical protein
MNPCGMNVGRTIAITQGPVSQPDCRWFIERGIPRLSAKASQLLEQWRKVLSIESMVYEKRELSRSFQNDNDSQYS